MAKYHEDQVPTIGMTMTLEQGGKDDEADLWSDVLAEVFLDKMDLGAFLESLLQLRA